MTDNNITEGMGKKIVEALKLQADGLGSNEIQTHNSSGIYFEEPGTNAQAEDAYNVDVTKNSNYASTMPETINIQIQPSSLMESDSDDFAMPLNISTLKQLITKLPVGVTRQTGALIIRQTMEAMGTSMKDVLKEAQQYQESLNTSIQESQTSIAEHKKQIASLEKQIQQNQKQCSMLNDIISLFVQTNI